MVRATADDLYQPAQLYKGQQGCTRLTSNIGWARKTSREGGFKNLRGIFELHWAGYRCEAIFGTLTDISLLPQYDTNRMV